MREIMIAAVALLLAACSAEISATDVGDGADAGPYVLQIVAENDIETYYITGPEDRAAAARFADGVSTLLDPRQARLAVGEMRAALADAGPPEAGTQVNIRVPGFSLSIADDEEGGRDSANIDVNAGGREVRINARNEGLRENAHVRIAGASESDVRDFINDADDLSAETRQGMFEALGLTP